MKRCFEVEFLGDVVDPCFLTIGPATLDSGANHVHGFLWLWLIHPRWVLSPGWYGPRIKELLLFLAAVLAAPEATPLPILGPVHELRPKWIAFDVASNLQEMLVGLDRK